MAAVKVATRRQHSGSFGLDESQRLAQQVAQAHNQAKLDFESRITALENLLIGRTTVAMGTVNRTITQAQLVNKYLQVTIGAAVTLTGFPLPADDTEFYTRMVENVNGGGFVLTLSTGVAGKATAAIGAGGKAMVGFSNDGVFIYGPL